MNECINALASFSVTPPQVQLDVQVFFVSDTLRGDDHTELRVKFVKKLEDAVPAGED